MESLFKRLLKVALILGIFSIILSCGREKPTIAKIKVVDTDNNIVIGAQVTLCACPNPQLGQTVQDDIISTNDEGWAIIDYTDTYDQGTGGFRLMDVSVNVGDSLFGTGIIKLVEEEVNQATVVVAVP